MGLDAFIFPNITVVLIDSFIRQARTDIVSKIQYLSVLVLSYTIDQIMPTTKLLLLEQHILSHTGFRYYIKMCFICKNFLVGKGKIAAM